MKVDTLLKQLGSVRSCGSGKWQARCPAHDDRDPSLSIREDQDGRILLHCFAGCPIENILSVLGLGIGDLFPDSQRPSSPHVVVPPQPFQVDWKDYGHQIQWYADEFFLRSEKVFAMARKLDPSALRAEELDLAMEAVHSAYRDLEESERLADLAVNLKQLGLEEEQSQNASRR